jgi:erythromycin esterase-like protein
MKIIGDIKFMKKAFVVIIFAFCFSHVDCSQKQNLLRPCNNLDFHFELDAMGLDFPCWLGGIGYMLPAGVDTAFKVNGKPPVQFRRLFSRGKPVSSLPFEGNIQQLVTLPKAKSSNAEVFIAGKAQHLKVACLVVSGVTEREEILYSDTIAMQGNADWSTYSKNVSLKKAAFLHLNLQMQGIDSLCQQNLWVDRIEVKIGGKAMNDYPANIVAPVASIKTSKIIPLSFADATSYGKIPELKNKRIVALGETLHGSKSIAQSAVQLMQYRIENQNCKLVLIELPAEIMLSFNSFVQGDSLFNLDSLLSEVKYSASSLEQMSDFMVWLKGYNRRSDKKVWLLGMDYSYQQGGAVYLFRYLHTRNQAWRCAAVDSLCAVLVKNDPYKEAIALLTGQYKGIFEEKLSGYGYSMLLRCLHTSLDYQHKSLPEKHSEYREFTMYENTKFLTDLLCTDDEKITIYAHFMHANYYRNSSRYLFNRSFGSWMKDEYGSDYCNLALLAGSGTFLTTCDYTKKVMPLELPYANTLEYALKKTGCEYFYMPLSGISSQPVYIRHIGSSFQKNQFDVIFPAKRMDAVVYIDRSDPLQVSPDVLNVEVSPYMQQQSIERMLNNRLLKR